MLVILVAIFAVTAVIGVAFTSTVATPCIGIIKRFRALNLTIVAIVVVAGSVGIVEIAITEVVVASSAVATSISMSVRIVVAMLPVVI